MRYHLPDSRGADSEPETVIFTVSPTLMSAGRVIFSPTVPLASPEVFLLSLKVAVMVTLLEGMVKLLLVTVTLLPLASVTVRESSA